MEGGEEVVGKKAQLKRRPIGVRITAGQVTGLAVLDVLPDRQSGPPRDARVERVLLKREKKRRGSKQRRRCGEETPRMALLGGRGAW